MSRVSRARGRQVLKRKVVAGKGIWMCRRDDDTRLELVRAEYFILVYMRKVAARGTYFIFVYV